MNLFLKHKHAGGRGKAGGVKLIKKADDLENEAKR